MPLIEIKWNPDDKELRFFSLYWFIAFGLFDAAMFYFGGVGLTFFLIAAAALLGGVAGTAYPRAMKPAYLVLMILSFPIGFIVSHIVMAMMFYLVITPIGVVRHLLGVDSLSLKKRKEAAGFWRKRPSSRRPEKYFRQF